MICDALTRHHLTVLMYTLSIHSIQTTLPNPTRSQLKLGCLKLIIQARQTKTARRRNSRIIICGYLFYLTDESTGLLFWRSPQPCPKFIPSQFLVSWPLNLPALLAYIWQIYHVQFIKIHLSSFKAQVYRQRWWSLPETKRLLASFHNIVFFRTLPFTDIQSAATSDRPCHLSSMLRTIHIRKIAESNSDCYTDHHTLLPEKQWLETCYRCRTNCKTTKNPARETINAI